MGIAQFDINRASNRTVFFDGVGTSVIGASSIEEVMRMAQLNFEVVKMPMFFGIDRFQEVIEEDGSITREPIRNFKAFENNFVTVRTDTMEPLGVVGKNYEILQNVEAFNFLDTLVANGEAKFETAGLYDGAKTFITIKTDGVNILGDNYAPYILLTNTFDGSGAVRAMETNVRIFCSNCLARAIRGAQNKISIRHSLSLPGRMEEAHQLLGSHVVYLEAFKNEAEKLAMIPFTESQFGTLVKELYPVDENATDILKERAIAQQQHLLAAYAEDDLQNFNGSAWKAVQAVADAESHSLTFRSTKTENLRNLKTVMAGMPLVNTVTERLLAMA